MDDRKSNSRIDLQKSIVLLQNHIGLLSNHAKRNIPNESCAILFGKIENENFIAVNKPPGLLTIPDRHDETLPSLYKLLEKKYQKIKE